MSAKTKIEWCEATWTPIRARNLETGKVGWHCTHASPGCVGCYAESMNQRLGTGLEFKPQNEPKIEVFIDEKMLTQPLRWRKPKVIFVCSMTDLFGDFVSEDAIDRVWAVMAQAPQHTFIVLTKRSARMQIYLTDAARSKRVAHEAAKMDVEGAMAAAATWDRVEGIMRTPLPNVWLGVSIEDRRRGLERGPHLADTPAAVRLWSVEPLLEDLGDLMQLCLFDTTHGGAKAVDWVIAGGESGRNARPMHPVWVRSIRDQCAKAGVAFFFKQWGEWLPHEQMTPEQAGLGGASLAIDGAWVSRVGKLNAGRLLDGFEHNARPDG